MQLEIGKYKLSMGLQKKAVAAHSMLDRYFKFFGIAVSWNDWKQKDYVLEGYMKHPGLFAIVSRITSVAAQAAETFRVYKVKNEQKALKCKSWTGERATPESIFNAKMLFKDAYEYADNHPFNDFLTKPNPEQRANEFTQQSIGFKLLTGNRFWLLNILDAGANAGRPFSMFNLPPAYMKIVPGQGLFDVASYEFALGTDPIAIPKEMIIHSRYPSYNYDLSRSHLWGQSPLSAAQRTMDRSFAAEERGVTQLQQGGASGLLYDKPYPGKMEFTREQQSDIIKAINDSINGLDNAGAIRYANGDIGYHKFGLTAQEMAVLDQERFSDERLANIYHAPPGLFMASANATDNNIAAWNKQLISQAVLPALSDLRQDYNQLLELYGDKDHYCDWDNSVFPELQEDQEKLARTLDLSPYLTFNEKRIARGFDEDPNPLLNKYYVNGGLVDLEGLDAAAMEREMDRIDENDKPIRAIGG